MITGPAEPAPGTPNLVLPAQPPQAFAIYAFRSTRITGPGKPSAIPAALAACGIGVLTLDLGATPSSATTTSDDADLAAVDRAADTLRSEHAEPSLLIGHSAAGPAVLAAAATLPGVRAAVTVGSPAPRRRRLSNVPLLVLHAPNDQVVPAREAGRDRRARRGSGPTPASRAAPTG